MERAEEAFFGDLLKTFRTRKKLTQKQLAERVGVSRESISLWERGQFKPETLTMLHELARVLALDEAEKRLLFEAHVGTASILPLHNVPAPNPSFTGREEILMHLHQQLTSGTQVAFVQTQAISGLGGIGKTQVAIAYAYRFRESYHTILWAAADSRELLIASYQTWAQHLRLREREEREQHKVVEAVKRWLREHKGWLLIFDNLQDLALVREFVPVPRQGAVVLTTRRAVTEPVAQALVLDRLSQEEGALFLLRRAGYRAPDAPLANASPDDIASANRLVELLGGLPLALDQAGASMRETRCDLEGYLARYQQQRVLLLKRRAGTPTDHPGSVEATFSLAFMRVRHHHPVAAELLKLCAFLAPDTIPEALILEGRAYLEPAIQQMAADPLALDAAIEALFVFSLIKREPTSQTLRIHRLVQAVLEDGMNTETRRLWTSRMIGMVNEVFPADEDGLAVHFWPTCERLLPQALRAAQHIADGHLSNSEAAQMVDRAASYLYDRGRYSEAEPFFQQALAIREQALGPVHLETALTLHHLAILSRVQNTFKEAERPHQRALAIFERQAGPSHQDSMTLLNDLAVLYHDEGTYAQAEPRFQRVLAFREEHLGPSHPHTALSLNNLARLFFDQGNDEQAAPLSQRALPIAEQTLGLAHPQTMRLLNNLASLYRSQGKYEQAEPLFQRALALRERELGPAHPQTAKSLHDFALLSFQQGKYEQAEPLFQRALPIFEHVYGHLHFNTAGTLSNLARLSQAQGRHTEAEPLLQQAFQIMEQVQGREHPATARVLSAVAELEHRQGKMTEAVSSYQRVLAIREKVLGPHHTRPLEARKGYAALLRKMERHEEAALLEGSQAPSAQIGEEGTTHEGRENEAHPPEERARTTLLVCKDFSSWRAERLREGD